MNQSSPDPGFDVVLLGTDIGIYALARAFHERYGIRSTVITRVVGGPIANSNILDIVDLGHAGGRAENLAALERIGKERKARGRTTLLLANADTFSRMLSEQADWLRQWYVVPAVDAQVLDTIADKIEFARLCEELDIPTPRTLVADFTDADSAGWTPPEVDLAFPVVAKAAVGARYEGLSFEGMQKIYKVDTPDDLTTILNRVREAGFRDRFVVQELIPGDDTAMRSITAYIDQSGKATLLATAQVLLQEHTPLALGNPAAMVTTPFPELMEQAERLLTHVGYRGFANFDVKLDPRDGVMKFFEVNPRIGRNNYYVTAAGANVAEFIVTDLIENAPHEKVVVRNEVLYSVLPIPLVKRYLSGADLALLKRVAKKGVFHPLKYPDSLWRKAYRLTAMANYVRKYRRYYWQPTDTGF
ncbi:carboxylate--amine ligase [Ornithinicoccus hortensis]|uniref:D-aspartate ligase n=1 Tax=Ornithinicoccus hortensis TaxID=82346 RepID=A0A542YP39_9MICO|nr:carboxylate--amine ligase [Ornithinicoccus hortensis]TQL49694.1 D-aspartate ligase [Ornithinicoccus hortensis]